MATTDTKLTQVICNVLTKAEYEALADKIDDNQFYFITDENSDLESRVDTLEKATYVLMIHNINIVGEADGFAYNLCFSIKCPYNSSESLTYSKITTKEDLVSLVKLYSYQDICSGYYISFNVDVVSIGVNGFSYYQNAALSTIDYSKITDGITSISDTLQTLPLGRVVEDGDNTSF